MIIEHSVSHAIKPDLNEFISEWEQKYRSEIDQVAVFDPEQTSNWSMEKKRYFAKIFYHIRGHFHDFLWFMGSHAPDAHTKQIVLNNIAEEFSKNFNGSYPLNGYKQLPDSGMHPIVISPNIFYTTTFYNTTNNNLYKNIILLDMF